MAAQMVERTVVIRDVDLLGHRKATTRPSYGYKLSYMEYLVRFEGVTSQDQIIRVEEAPTIAGKRITIRQERQEVPASRYQKTPGDGATRAPSLVVVAERSGAGMTFWGRLLCRVRIHDWWGVAAVWQPMTLHYNDVRECLRCGELDVLGLR